MGAMRKAVNWSVAIMTTFYVVSACSLLFGVSSPFLQRAPTPAGFARASVSQPAY